MNEPYPMCCNWPSGESRAVMVMATNEAEQTAHVIWNERVNSSWRAMTGFDEWVPLSWLTEPNVADSTQR